MTRSAAGPASLELRSSAGAFQTIEEWLRGPGFFARGGQALVADLFLAYGLSAAIRRTSSPAPPEPCPVLPLVAGSVRPSLHTVAHDVNSGIEPGPWEPTWSAPDYAAAIERVRAAIERGDVYQVNLVQHLSAPCRGDPAGLAGSLAAALAPLRPLHGSPFVGDGWAIVSASPELFLSRRGRRVWTKPIKGTRPAGRAEELSASAIDAAEHVIFVDLERYVLSRL